MITPVVLSGGSGTRLWPLSRKQRPKQFINLIGDNSPFQNTILRLPNETANPLIICNEDHRFLAAEQLRQISINPQAILLEPVGRNTAPAIALAALQLLKNNSDSLLLVLPSDHIIQDENAFHKSIYYAKTLAEKGNLVTFGIVPNKPEVGYGYIKFNNSIEVDHFNIELFTEKPSQKDAEKFLQTGNYLWNSGMFMFKASTYLEELEKHAPEILSICKKSLVKDNRDLDFIRIDKNEFTNCPDISIDYAVMEHTKKGLVIKLDAGWSDVGSWESLMSIKPKDKDGNVTQGDVILNNVKNSYAYSSNRLISAIGVSGLIVVDTQDALLISTRNNINNINNIVKKLKENSRSEVEYHRKVYRPWGYYDSIDAGIGFQVKRIMVNPGAKLSLQKHLHRSEHWVIVKGIAKITCGKEIYILEKNQSTYIPKGEIHRLENEQEDLLEIIEIQTGSYLGEDDIIRLDDQYDRN
jgi:mannose-1-phosphate guanylyltransferase